MKADRSEIYDLAAKEPERLKEMIALYEAWAKRMKIMPAAELFKKHHQPEPMKPLERS
jgi:hypothetical protein